MGEHVRFIGKGCGVRFTLVDANQTTIVAWGRRGSGTGEIYVFDYPAGIFLRMLPVKVEVLAAIKLTVDGTCVAVADSHNKIVTFFPVNLCDEPVKHYRTLSFPHTVVHDIDFLSSGQLVVQEYLQADHCWRVTVCEKDASGDQRDAKHLLTESFPQRFSSVGNLLCVLIQDQKSIQFYL